MPHSEDKMHARPLWPWWRWAVTGLSALGLMLSAYLGWHYIAGGSLIGCSGGSPCDQVLGSRWSAIGGILPVSGLAAGVYLALLVASFYLGADTEASIRLLAWRAMLVLVGAAAGSAVWFIIVQKWVIGAFCPYCLATHITGLVLAALVIWQAPRQCAGDLTAAGLKKPLPVQDVSPATSRHAIASWPVMGLFLASLLAVSQIVFAPAAVFRGGESQAYTLTTVDPHRAPIVGSPDAPFIVTLLFDYECSHCQRLHAQLEEVIRRYDGKLAFVLCPAPLSTRCNPYIPRDVEAFRDSCELTKIALAVWMANRQAFPGFDRWMYAADADQPWHPRTLDAAQAEAVALVGQAKFEAALADPWIDRYLQTSVRIFGETGGNAVPKLVFGTRWVNPQPEDADELISILQSGLGVPKP